MFHVKQSRRATLPSLLPRCDLPLLRTPQVSLACSPTSRASRETFDDIYRSRSQCHSYAQTPVDNLFHVKHVPRETSRLGQVVWYAVHMSKKPLTHTNQ